MHVRACDSGVDAWNSNEAIRHKYRSTAVLLTAAWTGQLVIRRASSKRHALASPGLKGAENGAKDGVNYLKSPSFPSPLVDFFLSNSFSLLTLVTYQSHFQYASQAKRFKEAR